MGSSQNVEERYWHQRADERLGDPPPKVDPGAFSGQRLGWKTPKRTLWQCTASVCVAGVHCWEISLGVSRSMERDLLSVLSIYPRIILRVFIVYHLLVGFLFVLLYSTIMFMGVQKLKVVVRVVLV